MMLEDQLCNSIVGIARWEASCQAMEHRPLRIAVDVDDASLGPSGIQGAICRGGQSS